MDITSFLAHIWGPVILSIGLGIFINEKYYAKIYRDVDKSPFAIVTFGMFAITLGIINISAHNTWNTLAQGIVSLLGWSLLIKGLVCTIFPKIVDYAGDWWANTKLMQAASFIMMVMGAYLTWIGYFV
jgi:hypothetical protein